MASRAILLVALAGFLNLVRADDVPKLAGSKLTSDEAVKQSDVVFIGKVTDAGTKWPARPENTHGIKISISQFLRASIPPYLRTPAFSDKPILVTAQMKCVANESPPMVGNSYIFFAEEWIEGQYYDPIEALKVLPVTDDNIAKVKAAIAGQGK